MSHVLRFRLPAALLAGLLFSVAYSAPLDAVPSIDVVRNRLSLTQEQQAKLAPLFQQRVTELQALRTRLDQASSRQEKRTLLREAKQQANDFNQKVESELDVAQKKEWRELRSETREKIKERVEEQRDSGS